MSQLRPGAAEFFPGRGRGGIAPQGSGFGSQGSADHSLGYTDGAYNTGGSPYHNQPSHGYSAHQTYSPQGYPPYAYSAQGYAPQGYTPQGYPPQAYPPHGYVPHGHTSHGFIPSVAPTPEAVAPPEVVAEVNPKLRLGGAKGPAVVMPKKSRGGKLDLSQKSTATPTSSSSDAAKTAPAEANVATPTTAKDAAIPTPSTTKDAGVSKEAILKDIEKRRAGKTYVRDPRPHFSVVCCGHVDSGKSTISGRLLADNGVVDAREMDKLRREALANHREGWEYAYVMDLSEEERSKGKTHETGSMYFESAERRITVLDAPGHKAFVPSMIGGATQADLCIMVLSARCGEFETGFDHGGQTREHGILVRTCGVPQLVVAVNKMDDCGWSQERYDEVVTKIRPFFDELGYKGSSCVFFPVSGLTGQNLTSPLLTGVCSWYSGPTIMDFLNGYIPPARSENDILCLPLVATYKEDGKMYIAGKCESGSVVVGDKFQILPSKAEGTIEAIQTDQAELDKCFPGDSVLLRVKGIDETDGRTGSVLTSIPTTLRSSEYIQVRMVVLEVRNILSAGSKMVMHIHTAQVEVTVHKILATIDRATDVVLIKEPTHVKGGDTAMVRLELEYPTVVVLHSEIDRMGRFMLRDEGKTIAVGTVTRLYTSTKESMRKTMQE